MFQKIYIIIIVIVFAGLTIVFNTLPRPTISQIEKRELATMPAFSFQKLWSGDYTDSVSIWYSDTEPYREEFLALNMSEKQWLGLKLSDDHVSFRASDNSADPEMDIDPEFDPENILEYENNQTADSKAKVATRGIIIVGTGSNVRALMSFGGGKSSGTAYAQAANTYKQTFPNVNVYCMVVPSAAAFYTPEKAETFTNPQLPTLKNIFSNLDPAVKAVDIYTTLGKHASEDIYLRTDHHWSPLGAYYAAQKFAEVAKVPFHAITEKGYYQQGVVHGFVGTMYGYSKDISVKNAPEDFVFYTPTKVKYTTTYTVYNVNKNYQVTGEGKPHKGNFFCHFKDGSSGAYCTFMGGDTKLTVVRTGNPNKRRLIILKDSYGNALPGYLFYSFEEIHVIDARYFTRNMKSYVKENKITDILFANNIFKACGGTYKSYLRFLEMPDHSLGSASSAATNKKAAKPSAAATPGESAAPAEHAAPQPAASEPAQPANSPAPTE